LTITQAGKGGEKRGGGAAGRKYICSGMCVCVYIYERLGISDEWLFVCVIPNGMDGIHFETDTLHIEKTSVSKQQDVRSLKL